MWWRRELECCHRLVSWDLQRTWLPRPPAPPPDWLSRLQRRTVVGQKYVFLQHTPAADTAFSCSLEDHPPTYLVCQPEQHTKETPQVSLTGRELASARVVCSVQSCGAVDYQQSISDTHAQTHTFVTIDTLRKNIRFTSLHVKKRNE